MLKTERFDKEHKHLGGIIYPSDFDTECGRSTKTPSIAERIENDFRHEKHFRKVYGEGLHGKQRKHD